MKKIAVNRILAQRKPKEKEREKNMENNKGERSEERK